MKIWTQQKLAFWEELERNGIAYCNEESWIYKEFNFAYDWLVGQMCTRLSPPPTPEIKLPLWGWVQYKNYKCCKPTFSPDEDEYATIHKCLSKQKYLIKCYCKATSASGRVVV